LKINMPEKEHSSLASYLIIVALTIYLIVALFTTAIHIGVEYNRQRGILTNNLADIENSYIGVITNAIWSFNREVLINTAEGLLTNPYVSGIKITDMDHQLIVSGGTVYQGGKPVSRELDVDFLGIEKRDIPDQVDGNIVLLKRSFDIYHESDQDTLLGIVTVYSDRSMIIRNIGYQVISLLLNITISFIAFWLSLRIAFSVYLGKPLNELARATESVNLDNLDSFSFSSDSPRRGELKKLESAFNRMIEDLNKTVSERNLIEVEKIQLKEELIQAHKMEAVGQLAGGIAHDFNNILGGIMGGAELLKGNLDNRDAADEYTDMIIESAERAAELTQRLLAFSRRQPIASTTINLHEIIEGVVAILKSSVNKNIAIETSLEADHSMITGDSTQLHSIFLNLGINATHAMPDGGIVRFSTRSVFLSEEYCRIDKFELIPGNYVEVEVKDFGVGIPKDILPSIFEPFFTTKAQGKGTGLGLSAVYGTIQQHKGSINVYSEVGKGTSFQLMLPITEKNMIEKKNHQDSVKGSGLILLIDDEPILRITGKEILLNCGFKVITAENGEEGIRVFKENRDNIELVVLDMKMPVMSGYKCFFKLKEIREEIPVLLSSGFYKSEDIQELKDNGLQGVIRKPFRGTELCSTILSVLNRGNSSKA
jgi:signal transduction histidine kinase/CheY-like chemotaxis protein